MGPVANVICIVCNSAVNPVLLLRRSKTFRESVVQSDFNNGGRRGATRKKGPRYVRITLVNAASTDTSLSY